MNEGGGRFRFSAFCHSDRSPAHLRPPWLLSELTCEVARDASSLELKRHGRSVSLVSAGKIAAGGCRSSVNRLGGDAAADSRAADSRIGHEQHTWTDSGEGGKGRRNERNATQRTAGRGKSPAEEEAASFAPVEH